MNKKSADLRLEAEVNPNRQKCFETKYSNVVGSKPIAGETNGYQLQPNKWGIELRIYFNATQGIVDMMRALGFHIEQGKPYRTKYEYRINNNDLWWKLSKILDINWVTINNRHERKRLAYRPDRVSALWINRGKDSGGRGKCKKIKLRNYLTGGMSTGSPILMKNRAKAWDKCSW